MSLVFGGATSDRVSVSNTASIQSLNTRTVLMWTKLTTATAGRVFWAKGAGLTSRMLLDGGDPTILRVVIDQVTTDTDVDCVTGTLTTGVWYFLGFTFDVAATPELKQYIGTLTASVAEPSYAYQNDGSGGVVSDSASAMLIGNRDSNANAIQGSIAWFGMWNRVLTVGEIKAQQYRPNVTSGCVEFMHLGFAGTGTQADWSGNGNAGTVTGATVAAHVPLRQPFGSKAGWRGAYTAPAAAGSIVPILMSYYRRRRN